MPPSPTGTGPGDSDDDDDDDEPEFEVTTGEQALQAMTEQKKEKLHKMEMNEAAALRQHGADEGDDEDE
jgi:LPS O-antigen subunit length determinant protein (WzzB/FepE family)